MLYRLTDESGYSPLHVAVIAVAISCPPFMQTLMKQCPFSPAGYVVQAFIDTMGTSDSSIDRSGTSAACPPLEAPLPSIEVSRGPLINLKYMPPIITTAVLTAALSFLHGKWQASPC